MDMDSFIGWFLVNEIFSNVDAASNYPDDKSFRSSCWMYKGRSQKLFMGPVWDFDRGAGNVTNSNLGFANGDPRKPQGWYVRNGSWMKRLFRDPSFAARTSAKWRSIKPTQLDTLNDFIDQTAAYLVHAQVNNFRRGPILDKKVASNPAALGSYQAEVDALKSWMTQRIAWMDSQL